MTSKNRFHQSSTSPTKTHPKKHISILAFSAFILHQYGPSYHLSFGFIGLLLLIYLLNPQIKKDSLVIAFICSTLILASYALFIIRYTDTTNALKILRYTFNAFILILLLHPKSSLPAPNSKIVTAAVITLLAIVSYQNLIDIKFQVPSSWFALSNEKDVFDDSYLLDRKTIRASGPYSEPSVLGMIFCCLFSFTLRLKDKIKITLSTLCLAGVLLSGSLLGIIGITLLYLSALREGIFHKKSLVIILLTATFITIALISFTGLELAFLNRTYTTSNLIDSSTQVRLINPFILIYKIFTELNLNGFPGDIYKHYLYLRMYDSIGNFPGHNGFLGLIMSFGLLGLWLIWHLFRQLLTFEECILLTIIGSQSGNFLSYEKVFLMVFVILSIRKFNDYNSYPEQHQRYFPKHPS